MGVAARPILKWAGGKARLAEAIDRAFGEECNGTYLEPFVGAAAVYLYRRRHWRIGRSVLSDVNEKLVETHRAVRDDVEDVLDVLGGMPVDDWRDHFYDIRVAFNTERPAGVVHAARFIWLNRCCFNGLYRVNGVGAFNSPPGTELVLPAPDRFRDVSAAMQGVFLRAADYRAVMASAGDGDQVYCDPPYVPRSATSNFVGYSSGGFSQADHVALGQAAFDASRRGATVLISNAWVPGVTDELYPEVDGFEVVLRRGVRRSISASAAGRGKAEEVLVRIGLG